jgi:H+/Cl- antiporter ClcA
VSFLGLSHKDLPEGLKKFEQLPAFTYLFKWGIISLVVGVLVGSGAAWFLMGLDWATQWRGNNMQIIWLLPIGGLLIGLSYHYYGQSVVKGNNQLLDEIIQPKKIIPLRMAPLVVLGTIATHLFGGSAGREGTAVQMGGAIADQFTKVFKLNKHDRKILLIMGISAGFSAVFGTPLAGAVFGLEVYIIGRMRYEAIVPSFLVAVIADRVCIAWQYPMAVTHTHYTQPALLEMTPSTLGFTIFAGILFGFTSLLFSNANHFFAKLFKTKISWPPLRPFIGGIVLAIIIYLIGLSSIEQSRYIGLGIPIIEESFLSQMNWFDFLAKIALTAFTLGCGFKGGEVTPLFFIGATLGSALSGIIPLPVALLAAMGFVGVFAGATNTPIACTLMGIELFGAQVGVYLGLSCICAYLFSGHTSIYRSQLIGHAKNQTKTKDKGKILNDLEP